MTPTYGTCTYCLQVKRLRADGTLRAHTWTVAYGPNAVASLDCHGAMRPSAQQQGWIWDIDMTPPGWVAVTPHEEYVAAFDGRANA